MKKVISHLKDNKNYAALDSPTGTGKTACLLSSSLAWLHHEMSLQEFKKEVPYIIYLTRTHSQIKQVVSELKSSAYRPKV